MQEKTMIFLKKKHVIPKQGGGGCPIWEKFPHFPVFFFLADVPYPAAKKKLGLGVQLCILETFDMVSTRS